MTNRQLQQEIITLRDHLQRLQSANRVSLALLLEFRAHLISANLAAPIATMAGLLGELEAIRRILAGEGGARC